MAIIIVYISGGGGGPDGDPLPDVVPEHLVQFERARALLSTANFSSDDFRHREAAASEWQRWQRRGRETGSLIIACQARASLDEQLLRRQHDDAHHPLLRRLLLDDARDQ